MLAFQNRRINMRCLVPALAATVLAGPAFAGSMPSLIPTHDVSGTYLVTGQDGARTVSVEYSKSANVLRINMQNGGGYILYDFTAKDGKMVMPQMQRYMDSPEMAHRAEAIQDKADSHDVSVVKGGTETIAGHECTDYTATDKTKGTSSTMCVTDDGVLLKIASDNGGGVAQTISYATVPAADVQVPAGYTPFVMPQMPAGMSGMAAGAMSGMSGSGMSGSGMPGGMPVPGSTP
jgi:hypothetical protein